MKIPPVLKSRSAAYIAATLALAGVVINLTLSKWSQLALKEVWKDQAETDMATGRSYTYRSLENSPTNIYISIQDGGQWVSIIPASASRARPWNFGVPGYGDCPVRLRLEGEEAIGFGGMCSSDSNNKITLMPAATSSFISLMQRGAGRKLYISFQAYDGQVVEEVTLPEKYPI